jgi:hypothetical protein
MSAFYTVICQGKYSYENDHIAKPLDEQLAAITALVWSGEWDDVTACHLVDPVKGTCVDALRELAEEVDERSRNLNAQPCDETLLFIERVLKRTPWFPPSDEDEREPDPRRYNEWARQQTSWGA